MKHLIVILLSLGLFCSLQAEKLFHIDWNDPESGLTYQQQQDHGGNYQVGPQAIAVDQNRIYLLDNFHNRIVVFNKQGDFQESISYQAQGCGLAVHEGTLVVFSPADQSATWITGELAGTVRKAPFPLSEVWFAKGEWWGRGGWRIACLSANKQYPHCLVFGDTHKLILYHPQSNNFTTFAEQPMLTNTWKIGSFSDTNKNCIAFHQNGRIQIFTCDQQGNSSEIVTLKRSWTETFSTFTIAPDKSIYEMTTTPQGITIFRQDKHLQTNRQISPTRNADVPQELRELLSNQRNFQSNSSRLPTYINVFFRNEGRVRNVSLQSYLKGVVSAEIFGSWHLEAHKAMAVAARTYAIARTRHPETNPSASVCTSTHCQAWTSNTNWKAEQGVTATDGIAIYYNGSIIREALYFAHCNGYTRNSEDVWNYVPYLRSQPCNCGHKSYYGHGVGACQWGLQTYAKQGWNFKQILEHYYHNTIVR